MEACANQRFDEHMSVEIFLPLRLVVLGCFPEKRTVGELKGTIVNDACLAAEILESKRGDTRPLCLRSDFQEAVLEEVEVVIDYLLYQITLLIVLHHSDQLPVVEVMIDQALVASLLIVFFPAPEHRVRLVEHFDSASLRVA